VRQCTFPNSSSQRAAAFSGRRGSAKATTRTPEGHGTVCDLHHRGSLPVIRFDCPHCRRLSSAQDRQAGKRTRCPGCGQLIIIPSPPATAAPPPAPAPPASLPAPAPARPWPNLCTVVAFLLGVAALPVALFLGSPLFGVAFAVLGLLLALAGLIVAIARRGAGLGFAVASLLVCGSTLLVSAILLTRPGGAFDLPKVEPSVRLTQAGPPLRPCARAVCSGAPTPTGRPGASARPHRDDGCGGGGTSRSADGTHWPEPAIPLDPDLSSPGECAHEEPS
jgi:hypothetical protein